MKVYIAGKYSADNPEDIAANIKKARDVMVELIRRDYIPICPHTMLAYVCEDYGMDYYTIMNVCLSLMNFSDCVLLLDNWSESHGANLEFSEARKNNKPIFHSIEELDEYKNSM